ncbi:MAG: hypothetical protein SCK70_05195, partial [bacterium]|nr:hypothetical protein [bacterium]
LWLLEAVLPLGSNAYVVLKNYEITHNILTRLEFTGSIGMPGGLASGVYLYQLEAGKFKQTRKMLLVR